jgi:hypothetical protein
LSALQTDKWTSLLNPPRKEKFDAPCIHVGRKLWFCMRAQKGLGLEFPICL